MTLPMKIIPVALITVALTAGCQLGGDKANEPFKDAPRNGTNNGPAKVITMPDGFGNAAFKCNGKDGVYTLYHGNSVYGSIAVVPNDSQCP